MPRVCFKPTTWYIEMHHVRAFFCVASWLFPILRDVHSQCVYLQEESLPLFLSCRMRLNNRSEFVLIIFYLHLINSGYADSSMADKKHGKLSSWRMSSRGAFQCTTWLVWNKLTRHQKCYSEDGKKFRGCRGLLGRVIRTGVTRSCSALSNYTIPVHVHVFNNKGLMFS